jgi:hypothetical protein
MKTKAILFSLFFVSYSLLLVNCSGEKRSDAETTSAAEEKTVESDSNQSAAPQFEVDVKFQEQLAEVFASYVALKDALVLSDADKVKTEAKKTKDALAKIDIKLLTGAALNDWTNYFTPIESSLKEIEANTDIESQRKSFSAVSDNLYKSVKAFGLGGKEAFYEYCPMAFNNEGGYWLSDKSEIRNPYFGDKMLTCGSVVETLR